jgi:uncharacterized protein (DUF362 family)
MKKNRTTTKVRAYEGDNNYLKILALKISAKRERITTTAEVLNGIINEFKESGNHSIDKIVENLSNRFNDSL